MMRPARALGFWLAAACAGACSKDRAPAPVVSAAPLASRAPRPAWPALPTNQAAAKEVIAKHTRRTPTPEPPESAESLGAALERAAQKNELRAGWASIASRLSERSAGATSYVLFGTFHDAPAQLVAFRQLFGPLGFAASDATLEQFHAPGRWQDAEAPGDGPALERFGRDGDRAALEGLLAAQRDHDYTAWKFDYVEDVLALAATLRASGVALRGCDMPGPLQDRVRPAGDEATARLRELHCVLALEDSLCGRAAKVAMLWGAEHVASDGVQRFLPADASVSAILVFGGRSADDSVEAHLADSLRLTAPVLVPVEGKDRFALLLPEGNLRASVDRVRTGSDAQDASRLGKLEATSDGEVELWLDGKPTRVGTKVVSVPLAPGDHGFFARPKRGPRVAGVVTLPERGFVELALEAKAVRIVVRGAR